MYTGVWHTQKSKIILLPAKTRRITSCTEGSSLGNEEAILFPTNKWKAQISGDEYQCEQWNIYSKSPYWTVALIALSHKEWVAHHEMLPNFFWHAAGISASQALSVVWALLAAAWVSCAPHTEPPSCEQPWKNGLICTLCVGRAFSLQF